MRSGPPPSIDIGSPDTLALVPTRLMCKWENRASGLLNVPIGDFGCRWILHCCHSRHVETHSRMSAFMLGQTKRSAMSLTVAHLLGCDDPCKCRNTCFRNAGGT